MDKINKVMFLLSLVTPQVEQTAKFKNAIVEKAVIKKKDLVKKNARG